MKNQGANTNEPRCYCCGAQAQGNYSIRFCIGPEVPLCDACGKDETPTCQEIWEEIAYRLDEGSQDGR